MNPQCHIPAIYYKHILLWFGTILSNMRGLICSSQLIKTYTQLCLLTKPLNWLRQPTANAALTEVIKGYFHANKYLSLYRELLKEVIQCNKAHGSMKKALAFIELVVCANIHWKNDPKTLL